MALFQPQKIQLSNINGGNRYVEGQTPTTDTFNAPLEASAYAQQVAEDAQIKADQALNYIPVGGNYPILSAYPIGSVFISASGISPSSLFGGTWERIEDRFLVSAGDSYTAGSYGGLKEHYHKADNMSALLSADANTWRKWHLKSKDAAEDIGKGLNYQPNQMFEAVTGGVSDAQGRSEGIEVSGYTSREPNEPPYLSVYMWKRIA